MSELKIVLIAVVILVAFLGVCAGIAIGTLIRKNKDLYEEAKTLGDTIDALLEEEESIDYDEATSILNKEDYEE